jgi:hypothetical protein
MDAGGRHLRLENQSTASSWDGGRVAVVREIDFNGCAPIVARLSAAAQRSHADAT